MIHVYTDGGSRGNPGPAAYGVSITNENGLELAGFGRKIGISTNNIAEYTAVIEAFNWLISNRESFGETSGIHFFMDSQLVASQLNGIYKVKHPNMQQLFLKVISKQKELGIPVRYSHIPRAQNKKADAFVNQALDSLY